MAVSPSGDPPDEAQAIDATCTIRLPDTATVLVHDTTETVMWRRFTKVPPSTGTESAKRSLQRFVAVQWKDGVIRRKVRFRDFELTGAELAEAASSVVGGGNNRFVSHVSQPQDDPEWVNPGNLLPVRDVRCSLPELTFGLLPRSAKRRHSRLINRDFAKALYGMCFEAPQDL
jgi:hypothetical protein